MSAEELNLERHGLDCDLIPGPLKVSDEYLKLRFFFYPSQVSEKLKYAVNVLALRRRNSSGVVGGR